MEELPGTVPQQGAAVAGEPDVIPIDQSPVVHVAEADEPAIAADDNGIIPIADEPEESGARRKPRGCPACQRMVPAGAVICVLCGYDFRKGFQPGRGAGAGVIRPGVLTCPTCGYDLRGLKSPKCPECGETASAAAVKDVAKRRTAEEQYRFMYILPWAMLGSGLFVSAVVLAATGRSAAIPWYMVLFAGQLVSGFIVYVACGLLWIGFDAPLWLQAVRLGGISAVMMALRVMASLLGARFFAFGITGMFGLLILGTLYCWMLAVLLDLDFEDAWLLAAMIYVGQLVAWLVLGGMLGL